MILSFVYRNGTSKNYAVRNLWISTQQPCLSCLGMIKNLSWLEGRMGRVEKQEKIYPELGQCNRLGFCQWLTLKVAPCPPPPPLDEGLCRLLPLGSVSALNYQSHHWTGAKVKPKSGRRNAEHTPVCLATQLWSQQAEEPTPSPSSILGFLSCSLSTLLCLVKLGKPGWEVVPHLLDP